MKDVIIVGAGPAGLTSALYASRAGLDVLVLEKAAPGGKVFITDEVENYPGFKKIKGRDLANQMKESALSFGANYEYGDVESINPNDDGTYVVKTNMNEYQTRSVIIATGMINRQLGITGETEFQGKGVSYCAICDGNFFKEQDVCVIGGGNSALEEALYLADICKSVTLIHRRDQFRAEKITIDKVLNKENINIMYDTVAEEIIGDDLVNGVVVKNVKTDETTTLDIKAVFIYIGFIPMTSYFENLGITDENNNILVDHNMRTSKPFIYGAGDVINKELRQITTAVNDGTIAAQSAINDLK